MGLMVDTDTHMLMEVSTILARDLLNHLPTMVMDTAVVMDMVDTDTVDTVERDPLSHTMVTDTDMVVKPLPEADCFRYLKLPKLHFTQAMFFRQDLNLYQNVTCSNSLHEISI